MGVLIVPLARAKVRSLEWEPAWISGLQLKRPLIMRSRGMISVTQTPCDAHPVALPCRFLLNVAAAFSLLPDFADRDH